MIKIETLDHQGRGIAKLDNKVVFVENALPDEIVDINILKEKKQYIEASVKKYIEKSKSRIDNVCPYYDSCGGCNILHLDYKKQLKFKEDKIKNIFKKYYNGKAKINKIVKSDNNFNYRNKAVFHIGERIGYYKRKTYEVINIYSCLLCDKKINESIPYLNKLRLEFINEITCRVGNNKLMIIIDSKNKKLNIDCIKEIANSIYIKYNNEYIHKYGDKVIYETLGKYKYIVSHDSFFQINLNVCEKLYNDIKNNVGTNNKILDLYCGTGSIGIYVSENNKVLGIELNQNAINNALENKKLNNIKNIDFICGDCGEKSRNLNFTPDIIIIDPPRSGLNVDTIKNIIKMKPDKIIYVSCDPMTLVRDLNILNDKYSILSITPYDMFPNTMHCESVVILERKKI